MRRVIVERHVAQQRVPVQLHHLRRLLLAAESRRRLDGDLLGVRADEVVGERSLRIGKLDIAAERHVLEPLVTAALQRVGEDAAGPRVGLAVRSVRQTLRVRGPFAQCGISVSLLSVLGGVAFHLRRLNAAAERFRRPPRHVARGGRLALVGCRRAEAARRNASRHGELRDPRGELAAIETAV